MYADARKFAAEMEDPESERRFLESLTAPQRCPELFEQWEKVKAEDPWVSRPAAPQGSRNRS
jgi:hypothetical protein